MPAIVTTAELGRMQSAAVLVLLLDRCSVRRVTDVDDAYGGQTSSEAVLATLVPCSVEQPEGETAIAAGKVTDIATFLVLLPVATDIQAGDILEITTKSNRRLRVEAELEPESLEIFRRVVAVAA